MDPLVAFEAAARHGSFVAAANELNITPSAVSQQIRALESRLGKQLFERKHRSVLLSDTGREFHNSVSVALLHLANAAQQLGSSQQRRELVLAVDTSIAAYWLSSRLVTLDKLFPDTGFRINVTDSQEQLLEGDFDIAVLHGNGNWKGLESTLLFEEEVYPVCAPSYLSHYSQEITLDMIPTMDLLDLDYEQWHWMNWAIWLSKTRLEVPDKPMKLKSNSYPTLIDAAKSGLGVALAWSNLVDAEIQAGTLVPLVPQKVRTEYAYYAVWPFNRKQRPAAEAFMASANGLIEPKAG